jgi:hypothetical protein
MGGVAGPTLAQLASTNVGTSMLGPKPTVTTGVAYTATGMPYTTHTATPEYDHGKGPMAAAPGGGGGRGAAGPRGYMQLANEYISMGWSQEAAIGTMTQLGTAAQMRGTERMKAPEAANKQLEEVMARAIKKGFDRDVVSLFGEGVAKTMSESAFAGGGAVGGFSERLQVLMAGLDKNATMRDIQDAGAARAGLTQLGQQNPYFNMLGVSSALGSLGSGASGMQLRLGSMASFDELIGGTPALEAAGISKDQRMGIARRRASSYRGHFGLGKDASIKEMALKMYADNPDKFPTYQIAEQAAKQMKAIESGVFDQDSEQVIKDTMAARKGLKHGDAAMSVFATQAKFLASIGVIEQKEVQPLIKESMKTGKFEEAFKAFTEQRAAATGEFTQGNQYVVQVMSGPIKKGQGPGSVEVTK